MSEMYSGLMHIHEDEPDRALFFVFQPRIGGPQVDEITIWMNGIASMGKAYFFKLSADPLYL